MSKIIPIFQTEVIEGQMKMTDEEYNRYRKWLWTKSGKLQFILKKQFRKRSLPQNAYFHSVIVPMIAEEVGEDEVRIKALLKSMFLSRKITIKGKNGEEKTETIVGRTSKLNTEQFAIFIDKCIVWSSSFLGIIIPDPDPNHNAYPILIEED